MDEPFASVDAQTRGDLEDLVLRVREQFGVTVLFVTHDIDESVYLADRIVVLTPSPTEVREVLSVDLPHPRDQVDTKELPEFARLRAHVYRLIKREQSTGGGGEDATPDSGARMLAATVLVATGCGDDGGSGGGGGTPEKPEKVKIGLIPIADVAPGLRRHQAGLLQGAGDRARSAVRGGRRGDHAGRDQRRLRLRLLEHRLAADRRLQGAARADRLPGRARRART